MILPCTGMRPLSSLVNLSSTSKGFELLLYNPSSRTLENSILWLFGVGAHGIPRLAVFIIPGFIIPWFIIPGFITEGFIELNIGIEAGTGSLLYLLYTLFSLPRNLSSGMVFPWPSLRLEKISSSSFFGIVGKTRTELIINSSWFVIPFLSLSYSSITLSTSLSNRCNNSNKKTSQLVPRLLLVVSLRLREE